jgi:DNA transformation protein and related proteins
MASKQGNVDFVLEQMAEAGPISARKMFGEYAIYCRDKIIALFCDDQLFVKPTDAGRAFIGRVTEGAPYPGAKPWLLISGDRCEDGEWLSELVRLTFLALPPPKPKLAKKQDKTPKRARARTKSPLSKSSAKRASTSVPGKASPRAPRPAAKSKAKSSRSSTRSPKRPAR